MRSPRLISPLVSGSGAALAALGVRTGALLSGGLSGGFTFFFAAMAGPEAVSVRATTVAASTRRSRSKALPPFQVPDTRPRGPGSRVRSGNSLPEVPHEYLAVGGEVNQTGGGKPPGDVVVPS